MLRCLRSSSSAPEAELPGGAEAAADRKPSEMKEMVYFFDCSCCFTKKKTNCFSLSFL